ncbi:MAG: class I SAM-dependent methyltransferase [Candidatus Methylacidiphilales bacterium]
MTHSPSPDEATAAAFATSWNHLPTGSVYTIEQFADWMDPLNASDVKNRTVLELGCGNGSLLVHMAQWDPSSLTGVDLGDSVLSARRNLSVVSSIRWRVEQHDLVTYRADAMDLVYCIGVLHHLDEPQAGFKSVIENTRPGGRFHCWVYAHEGNTLVRWLVEPLRRIACRLPWWMTKYTLATPLSIPVFGAAFLLQLLPESWCRRLPLGLYLRWLGRREWSFSRHVVFDQLVTPRTVYISKEEITCWLKECPQIDPDSIYMIHRNGNSWKFGGLLREA